VQVATEAGSVALGLKTNFPSYIKEVSLTMTSFVRQVVACSLPIMFLQSVECLSGFFRKLQKEGVLPIPPYLIQR